MTPVLWRKERAETRARDIADEIRTATIALAAIAEAVSGERDATVVATPEGPAVRWSTPEVEE